MRALRGKGLAEDQVQALVGVANAAVVIGRRHGAEPGEEVEPAGQSAAAAGARGRSLVGAIETLAGARSRLEGWVVDAARQLTGEHAALLLARKGAVSPEELTMRQRERWRAGAKAATRLELVAATGWGPAEVSDLVGVANAPGPVRVAVSTGLARGEVDWRLVRRFHRETASIPHEDAAAVANGLFGSDPGVAVTERLSGTGALTGRAWFHREFHRALDREVTKRAVRDPDHATKTRQRLLADRDLWVMLDSSGVASVGFRCSNTQAAAIGDRIESAARLARKHGDPRSLGQLRATIATVLLLSGTLPEPDSALDPRVADPTAEPGDGTPRTDVELPGLTSAALDGGHALGGDEASGAASRADRLEQLLAGLPAAVVNILVPLDTLLPQISGHLVGDRPQDMPPRAGDAAGHGDVESDVESDVEGDVEVAFDGEPPPDQPPGTDCAWAGSARAGSAPHRASVVDSARVDSAWAGSAQAESAETAPSRSPGLATGVGEVLGKYAHFLSGEQIRELALVPGSSVFRILTDPATGRYVERSTSAYRFDAAMRTHIRYADLSCRAPGCTTPAMVCQLDHVQEYGTPGGETRESNGAPLHTGHHDPKTQGWWDARIHPNRDITWTSLLGRIYSTTAHDYGQYTTLLTAATEAVDLGTAGADPKDREAAADLAIYAALTSREPGETCRAADDGPDYDPDLNRGYHAESWRTEFAAWELITLTHTDLAGRRRYEPDPEIATAERCRRQQVATGPTTLTTSMETTAQVDEAKAETEGRLDEAKVAAEMATARTGRSDREPTDSTGATTAPRSNAQSRTPRHRSPWAQSITDRADEPPPF